MESQIREEEARERPPPSVMKRDRSPAEDPSGLRKLLSLNNYDSKQLLQRGSKSERRPFSPTQSHFQFSHESRFSDIRSGASILDNRTTTQEKYLKTGGSKDNLEEDTHYTQKEEHEGTSQDLSRD